MAEEKDRGNQLMNVRELIDSAFGDLDGNTVNFRLIQTILYLIARQLRILERYVEVRLPSHAGSLPETASSFKVTEVKIHAGKRKSSDDTSKDSKDQKGKKKRGSTTMIDEKKRPSVTMTDEKKRSSMITIDEKKRSSVTMTDERGRSSVTMTDEKRRSSVTMTDEKRRSSVTMADSKKRSSVSTTEEKKGSKQKSSHRNQESETKITSKKFDKGQLVVPHYMEEYLDLREKELRVIHQRADSHEQPDEAPKPMDSVEDIQYEKLLVVERVPEKGRRSEDHHKISVVTQREFLELVNAVEDLRSRFAPIGAAEMPENAQLMQELRKNASLTDAMAALQLSARLEATEKVLARMMEIVTNVVGNIGTAPPIVKKPAEKKPVEPKEVSKMEEVGDRITISDLKVALSKVTESMTAKVSSITAETIKVANDAFKLAANLEKRLTSAEDVGPRMLALENLVNAYAEQINVLDTGLTSQVTNYQEQVTQMQHELEVGIEAMNEALASAQGGDTVAVAELNNNFINLQMDYESMTYRQKTLQEQQTALTADLGDIWEQIEILKETKSDRDELADALRDKAGIKDLNGIVSLHQFDAVRGDIEKRIRASYDKFNSQEIVWQKAIDELLRELCEKADLVQMLSLKDDIYKHLNAMKVRADWMADILGQPAAAGVNKKVFRDAPCLCCSAPASIETEEPKQPPSLPKAIGQKKPGSEAETEPAGKGDGDHKICYPGQPIPHPPHPRAHYCNRYCGGSHTIIYKGPPKVPPGSSIEPMTTSETKKATTTARVPCLPCQKPIKVKKSLTSEEKEEESDQNDTSTNPPLAESDTPSTSPPEKSQELTQNLKTETSLPESESAEEKQTSILVHPKKTESKPKASDSTEKSVKISLAHIVE